MKINKYIKKPKLKKVNKAEAFERLWGDGTRTISNKGKIENAKFPRKTD